MKILKSLFKSRTVENLDELSILAFGKQEGGFRIDPSDLKGYKYKLTRNFSSADLMDLHSGFVILPALTNYCYEYKAYLKYFHKTTPYTAGADLIQLGRNYAPLNNLAGSQNQLYIFDSYGYTYDAVEEVNVSHWNTKNVAVNFTTLNGTALTGGDGTAELVIYYNIISL